MSDLLIREMVVSDLPYIMATGLRTWRDCDNSPLPDQIWFDAHRDFLERLLGSEGVSVKVACSPDLHNEVLGYIIATPEKALWLIYVRKSLRRLGISKALMQAALVDSTTPSAWGARGLLKNPLRSKSLRPLAAKLVAKK